jgi:predicted dehydrogenase
MKRIAVIGFGFMGRTHTANILKNPDLKLVALVDRDIINIQKNLEENSGNFSTGSIGKDTLSRVSLYSTLEECLLQESPDACVISVHTDQHAELTRQALDAGVHVFLEKPFSLDPGQCRQLIELAIRKDLILMIGHVVRFMPAYRILKEWIDNGDFGALRFLSLSRFSGVPVWGQWKEKQREFGSSGGALFDLVIHDIDYACWVLGIPDEITSRNLPGRLSKHDYVNANWKYISGIEVKIEGGNIFHAAFPFQAGYMAGFERASVLYSSSSPENILITTDTETRRFPAGDANEGFSGEMDYFALCLRRHQPPLLCSPESALQTIEMCYKHL